MNNIKEKKTRKKKLPDKEKSIKKSKRVKKNSSKLNSTTKLNSSIKPNSKNSTTKLNSSIKPNSKNSTTKLNSSIKPNSKNSTTKLNSSIKPNSKNLILNNDIKAKIKKAKQNYENHPEDSAAMHTFYDRIIRIASNSSDELFARKKPKENWAQYSSEEEYQNSLESSIAFSNKFTEEQKKSLNVIIFNRGNSDGLFSAYIAWEYITGGVPDNNVKLLISNPNLQKYGVANEIKRLENYITGKNVIIVDLSYNKETLEFVKQKANFFVFIDNHIAPGILELPYVYTTAVDSKKFPVHAACAAVWKFFYPTKPVSYFIQSVDSGDAKLYLPYLPDQDSINVALSVKFVKNQTKKEYSKNPVALFTDLHSFFKEGTSMQSLNFLNVLGQVMSRFGENLKIEVASKAVRATFKTPEKDYKVTVLNYSQPGLVKRLGKYMASQNPDTDFSVIWFYNYKDRVFDVTISTSHRPGHTIDLSKISSFYGEKVSGTVFKDSGHFRYPGNPGDINKIIQF